MSQEIQLTNDGSQQFSTVLDGVTYVFQVSFNTRMGTWFTNILVDGSPIVSGVGLVGGIDIVKQFTFILKNLFVINLNDFRLDATADDLGTDTKLYKFTDDEVLSVG